MSEETKPVRDYEVGRGKPPGHTRFKPGQSGNARGRPKGAVDHSTALLNAINERVTVTENGKRVKRSMIEIIVKQQTLKAAKGDERSTALIFKELARLEERAARAAASQGEATEHGSLEDAEMFDAFVERLKGETQS